jgi:hypothetical protein
MPIEILSTSDKLHVIRACGGRIASARNRTDRKVNCFVCYTSRYNVMPRQVKHLVNIASQFG